VTDLLLGDRGQDSGASGILPTVTGDTSAEALHAYCELFSDTPESFARASVSIEVAATIEAPALKTVPAIMQAPDTDDHSRAAAAAIPIAQLPAGNYVARAVISVDGRKVGEIIRAFRVVKGTGR
jgi:hypothetical protein